MLTVGAFVLLLGCVFGSYVVSGGSFDVLIEALPFEMWTIGGAGIAAFIMANSMHELKHSLGGCKKIFAGAAFKKSDYIDLLSLLYFSFGSPPPKATWHSSHI
jgi:chemotaxis protein MotA